MRKIGFVLLLSILFCSAAFAQDFDYKVFSVVLTKYVNSEGFVDYHHLKANVIELNIFIDKLGAFDSAIYESWNDDQKKAFWINTYNALSLKLICDNYPIEASFFKSFMGPKNSVQNLSKAWGAQQFTIMNQAITLDQIKNDKLKAVYKDARLFFALHSGAVAGPSLSMQPYVGEKLSMMLDTQIEKFLLNAKTVSIDRDKNVINVSEFFQMYQAEIIQSYGETEKFKDHEPPIRALLNLIHTYLNDDDKNYILMSDYEVKITPFDWSLNEKK